MNDLETRAAEFVRGVWHDYLEARDYSGIIRSFDEEVTWIGTGEGELCLSLGDAVRMLGAESQEWSGHFSIVGEDYRARQLSDDLLPHLRHHPRAGGERRAEPRRRGPQHPVFGGLPPAGRKFLRAAPAPLGRPTATSGRASSSPRASPSRATPCSRRRSRKKPPSSNGSTTSAGPTRPRLPLRARGHERPCV